MSEGTVREVVKWLFKFRDGVTYACRSSLPLEDVIFGVCRQKNQIVQDIMKIEQRG